MKKKYLLDGKTKGKILVYCAIPILMGGILYLNMHSPKKSLEQQVEAKADINKSGKLEGYELKKLYEKIRPNKIYNPETSSNLNIEEMKKYLSE